jgi:SAM-dependent methyltransferase
MTEEGGCLACADHAGVDEAPGLEVGGYRYQVCPSCGTGSVAPLPSQAEVRDLYGSAYFEGGVPGGYSDYARDEALHRRNARLRLEVIAKAGASAPGRIVDVGCATGFFLEEAREAGWSVCGVDLSDHARRAVASRGMQAYADLGPIPQAECDVICFSQILEHARDPVAMLREAHAKLRPGGLLFLETWDFASVTARLFGRRWQQIHPPTVLHLFTGRGLEQMLEQAGFSDATKWRALKFVSVDLVGKLAQERWGRRPEGRLAKRLGGLSLPYFLDDLVWWTGRR